MPRLNRKLTETEIRNAKPLAQDYKLYDEGGLRLLIRPTGTKVWQYPFKLNNKYNICTLGQYPQTGSAAARLLRDQAKSLLKNGIDPNKHKKDLQLQQSNKNANTFESVAREWYSKQKWADKHAKNILSRLEKDAFTVIGWKPIAEITAKDIIVVLKKIEERKALDVAKRINQYCTSIFDYALHQGLCDSNPAAGRSKFIQSHKTKNRDHLKESELADFLLLLKAEGENSLVNLAVKMLALTFVRPGELRGARWEEIDEKKALWIIPAERMKMHREHVVPLSKQTLKVIRLIRKISGKYKLVFPGRLRADQSISDVALIKVVKRLTKDKATPHGFRHTASTILNENSFNHAHVERQLAHVDGNKVRGTYNKALYLEDRKKMMQWWADYLDKSRVKNEK